MTDKSKTLGAQATKRLGRPKNADSPRISYHDLDRLLVFGEMVDEGDGLGPVTKYPSYRELAARYGVSHSLIAAYASRHQCLHRREVARQRPDARTDEKLIDKRASDIADCSAQSGDIIEGFITEFKKALAEGRVRSDSVSDFNMMVRLKEYLQGGADSRVEKRSVLFLESLQVRYARMLANRSDDPALSGMVLPEPSRQNDEQWVNDRLPQPAFDARRQNVSAHSAFTGESSDDEHFVVAGDGEENTAASV